MELIVPPNQLFTDYSSKLQKILAATDWTPVAQLAADMLHCWQHKKQVFFCGNGGSGGNAIHLANDFLYGVAKRTGAGIKVHALSANAAVITCLANDVGYERIFSEQLAVQGQEGDLLIGLSGSGNSPNIVEAIKRARMMGIKSYAILGYTGGKCKTMADVPIHFAIDDMQVAEDLQLVVGHMLMQYCYQHRPQVEEVKEKEYA